MNFKNLLDTIKGWWSDNLSRGVDDENISIVRREKIIVFIVAFLLALGLWFLVNMSRSYNLDIKMPLKLGNIPESKALASDLPETATVNLQGEGWKLVSLYNNPPEIYLNIADDQINLHEQVREQLSTLPTVTVLKVSPVTVDVELDDKVSKTVPVVSNLEVSFRDQFGFLESPRLEPDSVEIRGSSSRLEEIDSIVTRPLTLNYVSGDIDRKVPLAKPGNRIEMSTSSVRYVARVAEFTEGESTVEVVARNVPPGKRVTFSPSMVSIRYEVPIQEYKESSEKNPFAAYVSYKQISRDSTGYVDPQVEVTNKNLNIRIRSYQPDQLSYYHVLGASN